MPAEISIVIVCYEMAREIPRTLLSLSPSYQKNCPTGRCEIILIDNGSRVPPEAAAFGHLGLDLTVHHLPKVSDSPIDALNFGIAQAEAPLIGVWIDGARLASPGLVDACAKAAALHPRPVVATINYHLGPDYQYVSMTRGYNQAEEDRLLDSIGWPEHGDRLFEISTPAWQSGLELPMLESNALFMPRAMWDELGGFDPAFKGRAGGAVNPDVFFRACALPGAQLIRIMGEGTFHQIHGGAAYNSGEQGVGVAVELGKEFYRIRKKPMAAVRTPGWRFNSKSGRVTEP